jgi:glycosyltransferase involved in cell wall biosynthesis
MNSSLNIGILGTRGIPNRYGGFEQCAEYLALGLVEKGHRVWVYNSNHHEYKADIWKGVNIIHCKDPERKLGTFGQFIYDWNCFTDARKRKFDILLQLGYTSSSVWHRRWPKQAKNIVNMDGLEWKRSKYNKYVQRFLKRGEQWAAFHADALVADSAGIQHYLKERYNKTSYFIPYGAEEFLSADEKVLEPYSLKPYDYLLLIARMEPENNIEPIIKGYMQSRSSMPLVIVGKTNNTFGKHLVNTYGGNSNIIFLGGIYDSVVVNNLRYYSLLYFHGHSVGGTNPSLLEAMACRALIAAHNNVFNRSVLGEEDAFYFTNENEVASIIRQVKSKELYHYKLNNNLEKIWKFYNWSYVVSAYERVFFEALKR